VQNLKRDLIHLPSRETALILGLGGLPALLMGPSDGEVSSWASAKGDSSYTAIGNVLGDAWVQGGAAIGTYAIGALAHKPLVAHVGADLVRSQALNAVLTRGLKVAVGRSRPDGGRHSFPSGHSSASFASAAVLQAHFGWKAGLPAYATAGFIGWTRVRDDQHWLTDAIAGSVIGAVSGLTVTRGHDRRGWTVQPLTSGGIGLALVRTPGVLRHRVSSP
jgi:membrane-associated phospholipid phosphatase